jgi:hypothetical protein
MKSCPCRWLIKRCAMMTYGAGEEVYSSAILDLCTKWEWSASRPGNLTPSTHWIGGWVSPRAGLDAVEKRRLLSLPGLQPLARRYTDRCISTPTSLNKLQINKYINTLLICDMTPESRNSGARAEVHC